MTTKKIITRFAPSPTGFLHIGGARTALFNYYFAKHVGGEFHLRIEDTDKARSTDEATQAILDGLDWLGLSYDGEIVYQSRRAADHAKAAKALLESGHAYRCPLAGDELDAEREKCRNAGTSFRSPYRDKNSDVGAIRFRVPDGETRLKDHVQGDITWDNNELDDLVLMRADGTPTYMLAVIVDDHDMGVTHVIRGDDHLINAARQQQIYKALGWDVPEWAHVPLIHGPDGKKLSKRHGALGVEAYRDMGYLPSSLRNYLVKLGWAHGDDELFFDDADIAKVFTLDGINASPARLDFDKMDYINSQHIAQMEESDLFTEALPFMNEVDKTEEKLKRFRAAIPTLKPRAKTLKELIVQADYLLAERPLTLEGKTAKPLEREGALQLLAALTLRLKGVEDSAWAADKLQQLLTDIATENDIGFGRIGQPVRAALTGGKPSPDLSVVMALLGKEECVGRLSDCLTALSDD
ncbi:glutamate--tRNA ligase [Litorimonas haliclonae]|uniref:glutamate--tRNA ligase n=1 Tax=Litorimonas haliclonae TaxID=2081977 RepID=UPI0039F02F5C